MRAALVTGGAARIGRAIVEDLAASGWAVAIHCRRSVAEADVLASTITAAGGTAAVVVADLADPDAAATIVPASATALGPLTLLVNNASLFEGDELPALSPDLLRRHLAINLEAPCLLARDFAAQVPAHADGLVVNIIDQRVLKPTPRFFSYQLSKSGLWAATRTMAQALAPRIRVNAIGPGPTLGSVHQVPGDFERQTAAVLLGHGPALSEFGGTIRYLVEARSVTGQMILLDGGQHLAWETPDVVGVGE